MCYLYDAETPVTFMKQTAAHHIAVTVKTTYVEEHSDPAKDHYVFAYTIHLTNRGDVAARLLTRHWIITDANGKHQEVHGNGVVGKQPYLTPGGQFEYTSGTVLDTPLGFMQGSYQMLADDGTAFDTEIPVFRLSLPRLMH